MWQILQTSAATGNNSSVKSHLSLDDNDVNLLFCCVHIQTVHHTRHKKMVHLRDVFLGQSLSKVWKKPRLTEQKQSRYPTINRKILQLHKINIKMKARFGHPVQSLARKWTGTICTAQGSRYKDNSKRHRIQIQCAKTA